MPTDNPQDEDKRKSCIGDAGLEGVFQAEYDLGLKANLKVRSAPNIAHLPYDHIIETLRLSKDNPLVALCPAASDEISTVLFGALMKKHAKEDFPVKIICTELNTDRALSFDTQLGRLQERGVLSYVVTENITRKAVRFDFRIQPKESQLFDVIYKIGNDASQYFAPEDAAQANFFREFSSDVESSYSSVAELLLKGQKKDKPIMLLTPDYEGIGARYAGLSKEELGKTAIGNLPGKITFVSGYNACSCHWCDYLWRSSGNEIRRMDYSILFTIRPGDLEGIPQQDLTKKLRVALSLKSQ